MRVLALDPGERVGWAAGEIDTFSPSLDVLGHGMAYLKDAALAVHKALTCKQPRYDAVVVEWFHLTPKGARVLIGSPLLPSQFIGMVRMSCWLGGVPIYEQPPAAMSSARRSIKNDLPGAEQIREIVEAADAVSHDDGHDGSAALHLWQWYFARYV